jgi:RNA polymerase sigma-70 factor (ECF subfamily)
MEPMSNSGEQWIQGARELNEDTLASIYDAFSNALFQYAYRLLGDRGLSEDIVAETFYRFLRSLGSGGGPERHLKAYLYRVTHNLIVDRFRRNAPVELTLDPTSADFHARGEDPEKKTEALDEQAAMRSNLWKLTSEQRQVIVLKYFEGLSNQEVAEVLGKPVGSVKSLQNRGLNALRRLLISDDV